MRWTLLVLAGAAGAYVVRRAQRVAEQEGRPLSAVLPDLPHRLVEDVSTIPRDLRMAATEGKLAAERRVHELDESLRRSEGPSDPEPWEPGPSEPETPEPGTPEPS